MRSLVAVGKMLVASQADNREPLYDLLLYAGADESVRNAALDRRLRLHQISCRDELDPRCWAWAQAPCCISNHTRVSGDLYDAAFRFDACKRVSILVAPQSEQGLCVAMPARLHVMRALRFNAVIVEIRGVSEQSSP